MFAYSFNAFVKDWDADKNELRASKLFTADEAACKIVVRLDRLSAFAVDP